VATAAGSAGAFSRALEPALALAPESNPMGGAPPRATTYGKAKPWTPVGGGLGGAGAVPVAGLAAGAVADAGAGAEGAKAATAGADAVTGAIGIAGSGGRGGYQG